MFDNLRLRSMKALLLILALVPALVSGQKPTQPQKKKQVPPELIAIRDEYIKAANDYQALLKKTLPGRERNVERAQDHLVKMNQLFAEGLVSTQDVKQAEEEVERQRAKITDLHNQAAKAAADLAALPPVEDMVPEYTESVARKPSRRTGCRNWSLQASQRNNGRTVTTIFKFVCQH